MILRLSLSATHRGEKTIRISVILKYDFAESTDNCWSADKFDEVFLIISITTKERI